MMRDRGQVLLIGGEKGGVGKSTITTNIAVEASRRKTQVIIIDTDPQQTSLNWTERRNESIEANKIVGSKISCVFKDGNIKDIVKDFVTKYDLVLIDASGRDSKSLRTGLTVADKFLCPIRASQADLETLPHICQLIDAAKDFNKNLVSKAVISCASTNPSVNEAEKAKSLLDNFTEYLTLLQTTIMERKIYRDALLQGAGVVELNNNKASSEITDLVNELLGGK
jgi:chromosome partitioning protein